MFSAFSRPQLASAFLALAIAALPFADLGFGHHDPASALLRMIAQAVSPDFAAIEQIGTTLASTIAFALAGVSLGAAAGFVMAPFWHRPSIRALSMALRSVHELFWALVLMQVLGISALTGVLAIALPYAGIFAKVFAEQIEDTPKGPTRAAPPKCDALSLFLWVRLPIVQADMRSYVMYRVECALRSSAVLGFIGLPTLGFQLDTFFKQGQYGAASAVLLIYVALIASLRFWLRWRAALLWLAVALAWLAALKHPPMGSGAFWRFVTQDLVPLPLRRGEGLSGLADWFASILRFEALPGLWATVVLGQIALALTGLLAILGFGLIVPQVTRWGHWAGHLFLVILRSMPEYILAYLFLQLFGPSMLPAILALGLHNGAIIAHLLGHEARVIAPSLRRDAPKGLNLLIYELVPRLFGRFVALCLYRWEIILRETAVLGMLGVATLGFYIDSAMAELKFDRMMILLIATGVLTASVDALSRHLRKRIDHAGNSPLISASC